MAAENKLISNAINIANNFKGIKYSASGSYRQPSKVISKYSNPLINAINFIASIYAKQLKVADSNATWNYVLADGQPQIDTFTPDQNTHHLNLGMVVAVSEDEWNELQITISKIINIIYPLKQSNFTIYTQAETLKYYDIMGTFTGGNLQTRPLFDANGNSLGSFTQGPTFANAWNNLKVPADAALGVKTFYIAPILRPSGDMRYYYRYTGVRRWASPFTGYDSY